ncbi:MAG: polysaccharide biosynthesis protein [Clostridiales bacterium]|jgi:stage V sporulation protein B|nr:polysaccharide biosynthesis protein [Clostridiales bacterium]
MRRKSIVASALILTAAGIITRLLGFVYRIYMSNILGAEGMGLYQLIMPVYALAWSIACSGFNTAISKLVAAERARGEYGNMGRILKQSILVTTSIGLALSAALYFFAAPVADLFFKDQRATLSLRILAAAFPFMAAGTCIRGFFFGLQETMVPAINQVLEQCVRMVVIYILAGMFIHRGLEYACAVAVIGIVCEEIVSFIYILVSYRIFKSKNKLTKRPTLNAGACLSMIMAMAIPLTANRVTGSLLATFENILIPQRLQAYGMTSSQAMSVFGQISGMAMPLIYFPTALLTSLSVTLVPAVSEAAAIGRLGAMRQTVSKSVLFAAVAGIGAAGMFLAFPNELGIAIYNQPIGDMLLILGVMCPFLYIQIIFSGVLNGLGHQVFIFKVSLVTSLINILVIYFLVPLRGINAFILGWFFSLIVGCAFEIKKIYESINITLDFSNWMLKPALSAAVSGILMNYVGTKKLIPLFGLKLGLVISVGGLLAIYCILVYVTGAISKEDLGRFRKKPQASKQTAAPA